ncbi:MAG: sugar ABC transporter ATP-binding protein [Anaerolineae bacterium]|nr:sugar ABC transporter ATP-binding protein [Anaerolineae bacterium]
MATNGHTDPVLSLRNIVKRFGGLTAVKDVDLDVSGGEVVGLVGDNGAGKSTLIKCISGVYHPEEGQIIFQGKAAHFPRPIDARDAGIETIYQDLALAGNLNVGANIFLGREVRKSSLGGLIKTLNNKYMTNEAKKVVESLDIHLPNYEQQINNLSGGQRQSVAIARAVYWDAKMMIMDEPTNNLGVPEQRKVLEIIRTLRERRVPVILISHTLPDVFEVADRIVIMHRGRKVADKRVAETNSQEVVQYMVGALDDFPETRSA